jgi:hypothetical protein
MHRHISEHLSEVLVSESAGCTPEVRIIAKLKKTQRPESASKLYRPSDCCLSAKLLPTFADRWVSRGQHSVSPYCRLTILKHGDWNTWKQCFSSQLICSSGMDFKRILIKSTEHSWIYNRHLTEVSITFGTGAAICTAVVVAHSNGRC